MENSRDQQYAQIEEPAKKSGRVRVHDEQTGAKKCFVSSDITRPRRYLFITELSSHITYVIYKIAFSVFGGTFCRRKQTPNAAPTREVCVFLTGHHPKTEKSLDEKFPYLYGGGV